MKRIASRVWILWTLMAFLAAGMGFFLYEYGKKAETWVLHSGNPHVYEGGTQTLQLGKVEDRGGAFLVDLYGGRVYAQDALVRESTLHWLGDRSGNIQGAVLQHYAGELVGFSFVDGLYGYDGGGARARLTISAQVQRTALAALGGYKGTIAVYNYRTGEILCAVSSPSFDPDAVPDLSLDAYKGVYWNRFTQAAYVPGSIFKIVTTVAALEEMDAVQERTYTCTGRQTLSGGYVSCERPHGKQDLRKALRNSCNCYYADLTVALGKERLQEYVRRGGVMEPVSFDGIQTAKGHFSVAQAAAVELAWAGVGQYTNLVNPCAFLCFVGAIANGGQGMQPYVMQSIRAGDQWVYEAKAAPMERVMSSETATILQKLLRNNVENGYGDQNFPNGMTVCAKSGTAEVDDARKPYAMFTGFVLEDRYPLAFLAAVEDAGYGKQVCVPMIAQVLESCKWVLQ